MSNEVTACQMSAEFLKDYLEALTLVGHRLRNTEESVKIINGLLESACCFYHADRAYVLECDWELATGSNTYEYCAEGVLPQMETLQQVPLEIVPHWMNVFRTNEPMIIPDVDALKEQYEDEHQMLSRQGIHSLLAMPFSKRINTGYLGVDNPQRYQDDPRYLQIITYAIVAELNEIKLEHSIDVITKHVTQHRDRDIRINCFGGLEIIGARGSLTDDDITTEQGACLLSYLLLNSQYPRPIRELADVLWPEEAVDNPYPDVKNVVYRLKRTLGLIGLEDLIIAQGGTFILNPHYEIQTDFERFEEACNKIAREGNHEVISALYHGAMDLYKGNLLPRFDHMQWQMPRSAYYENMYLRLVKCCIANKFDNHDYAAAQKTAVEALAREPYDTDLMVALTISMCKQGNRNLAYSYFCRIKPQLAEEQIDILMKHCQKNK